jgi:OmcA/MtrC family decaheme c-type cytochrome
VIAEQADLRSASVYEGGGVWVYQFQVPLPQTYLAPLNDTASFTDGELAGQALLAGTYSVGLEFHAVYEDINAREFTDAGTAVGDFLFGGAQTIAPRAVSQADNCNVCHTQLRAHDDTRKDVRLCVLCHTAGAEDDNTNGLTPGVTIEFKVMIHRIHNGGHLPSVLGMSTDTNGNRVYPAVASDLRPLQFAGGEGEIEDFSEVTFPVWPNLNVAMPRDAGYSALSSSDPDGSGPLLSPRGCEDTVRTGATAVREVPR